MKPCSEGDWIPRVWMLVSNSVHVKFIQHKKTPKVQRDSTLGARTTRFDDEEDGKTWSLAAGRYHSNVEPDLLLMEEILHQLILGESTIIYRVLPISGGFSPEIWTINSRTHFRKFWQILSHLVRRNLGWETRPNLRKSHHQDYDAECLGDLQLSFSAGIRHLRDGNISGWVAGGRWSNGAIFFVGKIGKNSKNPILKLLQLWTLVMKFVDINLGGGFNPSEKY